MQKTLSSALSVKKLLLLLVLCLTIQAKLYSSPLPTPYSYNPYVSLEEWQELEPYFVPLDSPLKSELDHIFSKKRVVASKKALEKAGFLIIGTSITKKLYVARHYRIRGYIVKTFVDGDDVNEGLLWKTRIDGAKIIQNSIVQLGYQNIMKVPQKWIYPLPAEPNPKTGMSRRNFVLIAEDMDLLNAHNNRKKWKKVKPPLLNAVYTIVTVNKLIDSVYAHNIPFSHDGKIAFVDTEHVNNKTMDVPLYRLSRSLSKDMKLYWDQLIMHGVP